MCLTFKYYVRTLQLIFAYFYKCQAWHRLLYIWYLPCIVSLCGGNSGDIQNWFGKKRRPWCARCRGHDSITLWCNYQSLLSGWTVSLTLRQTSMYIITFGLKKKPFRGLNIILTRPNVRLLYTADIVFTDRILFIILTKAWIKITVLRKFVVLLHILHLLWIWIRSLLKRKLKSPTCRARLSPLLRGCSGPIHFSTHSSGRTRFQCLFWPCYNSTEFFSDSFSWQNQSVFVCDRVYNRPPYSTFYHLAKTHAQLMPPNTG